MIKINIIAVSRLKEKYLRYAAAEYQKRLSGFCNLTVTEIEPVKLPEKPSASEIASALDKEAEIIIRKIPKSSTVIALCIEGKQLSSEEFAYSLEKETDIGNSVTFIIGSSYGLSDKIKCLSETKLSFSKMTFPHQLFRILLLEQIYRAFRINNGASYHK
ncbi:MAG: 23S rRNA (pseudouridine(1915)-N(3))-methyltransferase RlmH [Acutalibacteraceae bacterium]|nr:23S rRNA (pseudouridine(1915)-N(3))-methyltransferase RlmH [Acutalibacteraceae bacterium]